MTETAGQLPNKCVARIRATTSLMAAVLALLAASLVLVPGSAGGEPFRVGLVLSTGLARDNFFTAAS